MKKLKISIILLVVPLLISCGFENDKTDAQKIERLEDSIKKQAAEIDELQAGVDCLEEDFFLAYMALDLISEQSWRRDVDSIDRITTNAMKELGEGRFFKDGKLALDMMTDNHIYLDTATMRRVREVRLKDFERNREMWIRIKQQERLEKNK